jgi:hypothetical protein
MNIVLNRWGLYPWFAEFGHELVHPDDLDAFRLLTPYGKVFQVSASEGEWLVLRYSRSTFRVKDTCFREIRQPCFSFGETVREKRNPDRVGKVKDIEWHQKRGEEMYSLAIADKIRSKRYFCSDLEPVE